MRRSANDEVVLMFDPATHRVGCVLLQAGHGYGGHNSIVHMFNTKAWIVGEGMEALRPFRATVEQWALVAAKCNRVHPE